MNKTKKIINNTPYKVENYTIFFIIGKITHLFKIQSIVKIRIETLKGMVNNMKRRTIDLINDLSKPTNYSLHDLANSYHVTVRTIRNEIKTINEFLYNYGFTKITIEKNGLVQVNRDFSSCRKYLQIDDLYEYKLSPQERIIAVSCILLMKQDYTTLSELANQLYVSRTTIINDLPSIKKYLDQVQIQLHTHQNKGLCINNDEITCREALARILILDNDPNDVFITYLLDHVIFLNNVDRSMIHNIITEIESEYHIQFTKDSSKLLSFYLELMIERNLRGFYINTHIPSFGEEYHFAQDILRYICQYSVIEPNEKEINALGYIIKNMLHYSLLVSNDRETIAIQVLTRKLIEYVSNDLRIDLTRDYQLYENLSNHLNSIYHESITETAENPVLQDIRSTQKTIIKAVNNNIGIVRKFFHRPLSETDIMYIVIHFCAAIERYKTTKINYNVILVCNAGIGTSQLIQAKLVKYFHINVVGIISSYEIDSLNENSADLLISVIPIYDAPIEFINITPHLTDDDYILIGNKITELRLHNHMPVNSHTSEVSEIGIMDAIRPILINDVPEKADILYENVKKAIHRYFNRIQPVNEIDNASPFLHHLLTPEFIDFDVACKDWKEAIRKSAQPLLKYGYIENRYIASMIHGVEEYGPYIEIAPGLAIPHAGLNDGSYKTGMSMIRLLNPIPFGVEELDPVRYVVTLSSINQKNHLRALFHLLSLWQNEKFLQELNATDSVAEANKIIEKFEYTLSDY